MQPQPYVGIDLHRRHSVIVQRSTEGETVSATQVMNDDVTAFAKAVTDAGEHPEVVIEACYGWYWVVDLLHDLGCIVHLSHPLGNAWVNRRVKNDPRDAENLVDLLRLGRLAEAWIAPKEIRELRELVCHRAARLLAHEPEAPGPLGARQRGGGRPHDRRVRGDRAGRARPSTACPRLRGSCRVPPRSDRELRCPDPDLRARHRPGARRARRLPRDPKDPRRGSDVRGHLRSRDR
ncbi:MAG: IS110 family transposase [Acidimicrobiales bacterium]